MLQNKLICVPPEKVASFMTKWLKKIYMEKIVEGYVFPSKVNTITVIDDDTYGGAHEYFIRECMGFNNGETVYVDSEQMISFVKKLDDGTIEPGLQSEQIVIMLMDRHVKLNNRFPSPQNEKMIKGLQMFLDAAAERVQERIDRGVMGDLKK